MKDALMRASSRRNYSAIRNTSHQRKMEFGVVHRTWASRSYFAADIGFLGPGIWAPGMRDRQDGTAHCRANRVNVADRKGTGPASSIDESHQLRSPA